METKTNTGAIFKNDKKTKETHPDQKGKGNFKGVEFDIACWMKESSKGTKYFSCSFSEPYVNETPKQVHTQIIEKDDLQF